MKEIFFDPTPKQFFYLVLAYSVVALFLGYYLTGGYLTFVAGFGLLFLVIYVHTFTKNEKVQDKTSPYLMTTMILLFGFIFHSGILFHKDFITDRSQLQHITGTIPAEATEYRTSGKNARTYRYLEINHQHFNCSDNITDECEKIYAYKDKTATIYYQPDNGVNNLVYEIVVDNQAIYSFDSQLKAFQSKREKENMQWLWTIVLYIMPMIYLFILHRDVIAQLDVMTKEEVNQQLEANKQQQKTQHNQMVSLKDLGVLGTISVILGSILLIPLLPSLIIAFVKAEYGTVIALLILSLAVSAFIYYPQKKAKVKRDKRIAQQQRGLADNESSTKIRISTRK